MKVLKKFRREDKAAVNGDVLLSLYIEGKKARAFLFRFSRPNWDAICAKTEHGKPAFFSTSMNEAGEVAYFYYAYKGWCYRSEIRVPEEDVAAIVDEEERLKKERLLSEIQKIKGRREAEAPNRRPIPQDVQILVWNRDGGKCVKCGSTERLEFDHIIPISRGGSTTTRNLQLLCEKCNRSVSNRIGHY